jgi:O-glycosyl hydrolase
MVMDQMTPKTHVARHYFKFIQPGAVRVDATPSDGQVKASAYVHPRTRKLTVVLTNPATQPQAVAVELKAIPTVRSLQAFRTTSTEMMQRLANVPVQKGRVSLMIPAQSIVTLDSRGLTTK